MRIKLCQLGTIDRRALCGIVEGCVKKDDAVALDLITDLRPDGFANATV